MASATATQSLRCRCGRSSLLGLARVNSASPAESLSSTLLRVSVPGIVGFSPWPERQGDPSRHSNGLPGCSHPSHRFRFRIERQPLQQYRFGRSIRTLAGKFAQFCCGGGPRRRSALPTFRLPFSRETVFGSIKWLFPYYHGRLTCPPRRRLGLSTAALPPPLPTLDSDVGCWVQSSIAVFFSGVLRESCLPDADAGFDSWSLPRWILSAFGNRY